MAIRSHTIARAYLQRFASCPSRKGKLWVYERGKTPRLGTPRGEAAERGFYSQKTPSGAFDDKGAELWLQQIEDRALVALLHSANPCFVWTSQTRQRMAEYWALLFARASAAFEFHRRFWQKSLLETQERITSDPQVRHRLATEYSLLSGRRVCDQDVIEAFARIVPNLMTDTEMRSAYVSQLERRTKLISEILLSKPWQVWRTPDQTEFVTCDSPVVTLRIEADGSYFVGDGFNRRGILAVMPLSYQACLVAGAAGPQTRMIAESDVHEINKTLVCCSVRFTYSRTYSESINSLVQREAGSIRYGVDAFKTPNDVMSHLI